MINFSYTVILILLVYLPIFILSLKKDFKKRFSEINSMKKKDLFLEVIAGIFYFILIYLSLISPIKKIIISIIIGSTIYITSLIFTYLGYFTFYKNKGLITNNIFKYSRNPTYFFGFTSILGIIILTQNIIMLFPLIILFLITHKIILNEEKYLEKKYKTEYLKYKNKTRRYL